MVKWGVRVFVIVTVLVSLLSRIVDVADLLVFGAYPRERSIVFMSVDSVLLDVTWGVLAWRWWGR